MQKDEEASSEKEKGGSDLEKPLMNELGGQTNEKWGWGERDFYDCKLHIMIFKGIFF